MGGEPWEMYAKLTLAQMKYGVDSDDGRKPFAQALAEMHVRKPVIREIPDLIDRLRDLD